MYIIKTISLQLMGNIIRVAVTNKNNVELIDDDENINITKYMTITDSEHIFEGYYEKERHIEHIDYKRDHSITFKNNNRIECSTSRIDDMKHLIYTIKIGENYEKITTNNYINIPLVMNQECSYIIYGKLIKNDHTFEGKLGIYFNKHGVDSLKKIKGYDKKETILLRKIIEHPKYILHKDIDREYGIIYYENGDIYEGEIEECMFEMLPTGKGRFEIKNGEILQGIFLNGVFLNKQ